MSSSMPRTVTIWIMLIWSGTSRASLKLRVLSLGISQAQWFRKASLVHNSLLIQLRMPRMKPKQRPIRNQSSSLLMMVAL